MKLSELDLDAALAQFGLSAFRPGQREVISAIVAGHDCMCVMPTGGGKSLCYQLPSIIRPGLTIVVSPLIALMKDQVDALCARGIPAALINSTLSLAEQTRRLQDLAAGKYKLVYVAPERLRSNRFLEAIRATPIQLLAIDEAHCISQWGHDFRPDYARLGRFRELLGDVQAVALTATATPRVRQDIVEVLQLRRPKQFMSGFARPNLDLGVVALQGDREKDGQLEEFLKRETGSGIIYAATRKRCDSLVAMIQEKLRIPVGGYHAGLPLEQRRAIQERFMRNELRIIVATNAFGMGIDKPDLRFVLHYNMPGSLEAYYQEAGRAGRDGQPSQCVLLYSYQDRYIQEFFIENNYPPREFIESVYDFLCSRTEDPIELTHEQINEALKGQVSSEAVGSSLNILARTGVLERLETGGGSAMVRIDSDLPTLVDMLPKEADVKRKVLRVVERLVGSRRGEDVFIHPRWLMQELEMDRDKMNSHLRDLSARLPAFDYVPPFRGRATHFLRRGVPFAELEIDFVALAKRKEAEYERLNQVVRYAQTPKCRQAAILDYFGDEHAENCGHCDRCQGAAGWPLPPDRSRNRPEVNAHQSQLRPQSPSGSHDIVEVDWIPKTDKELANSARTATAQPPVGPVADPASSEMLLLPAHLRPLVADVLSAIDRTHGRLGKILIGQFLCGSSNAKIQKLRLHRLSGFGMLSNLRQGDAVELIDALLSTGLLQQQEVNRHRPTVSLSVDIHSGKVSRHAIIERMKLSRQLIHRLATAPSSGGSAASATDESRTGPAVSRVSSTPDSSERAAAGERSMPPNSATAGSEATASSVIRPGGKPAGLDMPPAPTVEAAAGAAGAPVDDWSWTWQLLVDGYAWTEVMAIRRKSDLEVAGDLQQALRQNKTVQRQWLMVSDKVDCADEPTVGQQRILRELQRRSAAGV